MDPQIKQTLRQTIGLAVPQGRAAIGYVSAATPIDMNTSGWSFTVVDANGVTAVFEWVDQTNGGAQSISGSNAINFNAFGTPQQMAASAASVFSTLSGFAVSATIGASSKTVALYSTVQSTAANGTITQSPGVLAYGVSSMSGGLGVADLMDVYGQQTIGTPATLYARVEQHVRTISLENGDYAKTSHMVMLDESAPTPSYQSYFWLPGDSLATIQYARIPKLISPCPGERGTLDHWEVLL